MKIEYTAAAQQEFDDAADFYFTEKPELGDEFCEEVQGTIRRIVEFPDAWTLIAPHTRRCLMRRFPYGIVYQIRSDVLLILAVMHVNRSPNARKSRIPPGQY